MKFGRWNVIGMSDKRTKHNIILWDCVCDCQMDKPENEREHHYIAASNMKTGTSKSCGCLKQERSRRPKGKIKDNTYECCGDVVYGYTSNGYKFCFDKSKYNLISKYCWHKHQDGYLRTLYYYYYDESGKRHNYYILMHRLLLDPENEHQGMEIDHINGCPWDNRLCNLRFVTHAQNMQNEKLLRSNKTGYKGVFWSKLEQKWKVYITVFGTVIHLGTFASYEDAVNARKEAEKKYHGEFARAAEYIHNGCA